VIVPVTLRNANAFVARWHRHHPPARGCRFCLAVADGDGVLHGLAIIGRPVACHLDNGWTCEVNRSCTDGTANVNSMLYGAAWRAARALGHRRLITYTLRSESGASLRDAGWRIVGKRDGRSWHTPGSGRPRVDKHPLEPKLLWEAK
jgi:hypothetical protein